MELLQELGDRASHTHSILPLSEQVPGAASLWVAFKEFLALIIVGNKICALGSQLNLYYSFVSIDLDSSVY